MKRLCLANTLACCLFVVLTSMECSVAAERPNVLFIAADDLRNDLGCYGHPLVKTPNLDALAARGTTFNKAYCQQALCNPSRASLLTGRRPNTLGIWNLPTHFRDIDPNLVTLPQHFKDAGYFTQNIGKVFHNWRQDKYKGDPKSWSVPAMMHYNNHGKDKATIDGRLPASETKTDRTESRDVPDDAYFDGRIADAAVKALGELKTKEQPFFLAVGFWKPHLPFNAPKKYWDMYDRESIHPAPNSTRPKDAPEIAFHNGRELLGRGKNPKVLPRDSVIELRHGYLAAISYLDEQVGKLLAELDRLKLRENTIVVFWSDHGFHLGEHDLWCKTSNFELDARVPLIISAPSFDGGAKTESLAELLDLYPTLVELCGLKQPTGLEGRSLAPVLRDSQAVVKRAAYTQHPRPAYYNGVPEVMGVSARTNRCRYTEWRNFSTGEVVASELYDHDVDPDENVNVVKTAMKNPEARAAKKLLEEVFPRQLEPHIVQYRDPESHVDLGVGLWAWPLPMDYDEDGDLDLVVSCPDVPHAGIYFFENRGNGEKMPVFEAPVRVGKKVRNAVPSYVDGKTRILVPGSEVVDFRETKFETQVTIYPQSNVHPNKVRANQWRYVDYDDDGSLDIIVGVGDWKEYGWDNAFNEKGEWQRGPLHGHVYLIRNEGSTDKPDYAEPRMIKADGQLIDVYGMPSPNFADFDGDGDLDLLCGEFLDGFTYFANIGSRQQPKYVAGQRLKYEGEQLAMDLEMINPVAIDWDGDGDQDLIVGDEDGRVAFVEHTGKIVDNVPQFLPPRYFQQQARDVKFGALVTPVSCDWDADGDDDLVCGNSAGYVCFIENLDGGCPPKWAAPQRLDAGGKTLRIQAGSNGSIQGPCEAKWGYTTLSVADWNHDGLPDLIVNSIWGRIEWYENVGTKTEPQLAASKSVVVDWEGATRPKPAWNWWDPKANELATQWRTTPLVLDVDKDGLNDLVMLDHEGYLAMFKRKRVDGRLMLQPGARIFRDTSGQPLRLNDREAGKSGRRKLCFADWDGDGKLDLLVNSRSIDWYRNVSTKEKPWRFEASGSLDGRHLAGHTTSPTVVDWNRDGRVDLLIGAEDGRLYYQPNLSAALTVSQTKELTIESQHIAEGVLVDKAKAYANRNYVWYDVPKRFRHWKTLQTFGGEPAVVRVTAKRNCVVYVATSLNARKDQLANWEPLDGVAFGYTDGGRTKMQVLRRSMKQGERITIPQPSWTGGILLLPPK